MVENSAIHIIYLSPNGNAQRRSSLLLSGWFNVTRRRCTFETHRLVDKEGNNIYAGLVSNRLMKDRASACMPNLYERIRVVKIAATVSKGACIRTAEESAV